MIISTQCMFLCINLCIYEVHRGDIVPKNNICVQSVEVLLWILKIVSFVQLNIDYLAHNAVLCMTLHMNV